MEALEAVSYLLFCCYIFSFLGLTAYASKQAGRSVWLFGAGAEPQAIPAWLFRLAFAGGTIWPLMRVFFPNPGFNTAIVNGLDHIAFDVLGHALIAIGAMVAVASQMHMGASWRIGAADGEVGAIVDSGPFALSRNPVFVGQFLLFCGLFLVFPDPIQALLTVGLMIAIVLQVRIEERVLTTTLGDPYIAYSLRVSRWLGRKHD
jgi:protein-S-isoprenylcysteine O-methyltransferase Ste14